VTHTVQQASTPDIQPVEHILVVKRSVLFPEEPAWQGMAPLSPEAEAHILSHQEFHPRPAMEEDPRYKQIIPYLIFKHADTYFMMRRSAKASETRLKSKYSLGIGGHIRAEDIEGGSIAQWAAREFEEEVSYSGTYTVHPLGIINDDSNDVGRVHVGFVYLLEGTSPDISIKDEHETGMLMTLDECRMLYDQMESWSRIVFDFLRQQ
jgi:predicted NUDIX family phosphoesterase